VKGRLVGWKRELSAGRIESCAVFTVQDSRWGTREQLVGGTVEVQVAAVFFSLCTISETDRAKASYVCFDSGEGFDLDGGAGRTDDKEPLGIFCELQDQGDKGEPNAVVDGLIDDLRDTRSIRCCS
jgi:hypothetical protein